MELSGSRSASSRRALVAIGLAAVVSAASVVAASLDPMPVADPVVLGLDQQAPPQQPAQPDPMAFTDADRLFVYFQIAPEQSADFELVLKKMKEGLTASTKPERQQQNQSLKVIKLADMQQGNWMYVFILDPVVKGVTYDPFKILNESMPADDVRQLYDKVLPGLKGISRAGFTEIFSSGGMN
jgi:hypothetical protein